MKMINKIVAVGCLSMVVMGTGFGTVDMPNIIAQESKKGVNEALKKYPNHIFAILNEGRNILHLAAIRGNVDVLATCFNRCFFGDEVRSGQHAIVRLLLQQDELDICLCTMQQQRGSKHAWKRSLRR